MKKSTKILLSLFFLTFVIIILGIDNSDTSSTSETPTSKNVRQSKKWYEDGGLNSKKVGEWKSASYERRLASAADMALVVPSISKKTKDSGTMETLKPYAQELLTCIDAATVDKGSDELVVSEIAAACAILMDWHK